MIMPTKTKPRKKRTGYCKKHPTYAAKLPPRVECEDCWRAFAQVNGSRVANLYHNPT